MSLLSFHCRHRFPGGFELDLSFELEHPVTSLFGPSGAGKTSVLLVIAGFLRPQEGRVQLGGEMLLETARRICLPPERRRVGMVFQDHLLFPHLTVEANLRYGQRRRRNGRPIDFGRVVEVLEIGGLLRRYPRNLSGGERQRVALGRALLSSPELLLMDEPLASLDAALKTRILAYLQRVVDEWRIPTLFVTHSQAEVRRLASWVIVMERGRAIAGGTPEEALSRPEPLAWRNATGPMNLLRLDAVEPCGDHTAGRVGSQTLFLPRLEAPATAPLFVQFAPTDVTLSRQDVAGLSTRNHLRGCVRQVLPVDCRVFVAVDIGQVFWAEVTPQAVAELQLAPGSEVTCLLKAHGLRVIS
jgi:molybdate transport system ATP-binding protein